jgi:DNA replication and repair protein RecF
MLASLRLLNFRCYTDFRWSIPSKGAVIVGNNAEGKTSLLEAVYFLFNLVSPRSSKPSFLLKQGAPQWGIHGQLPHQSRSILWRGSFQQLRINGQDQADQKSFLSNSLPAVWFGNKDMDLVCAGAEARRRFLDFVGIQWHPSYREELFRYTKVLRARNHLLKHRSHDHKQLEAFSTSLVSHGERLMQLREALIELIRPHIVQAFHNINQATEEISIAYQPSVGADFAQALEASLPSDIKYGQTQLGPHRDDFSIFLNGLQASHFSSEGQQRSIAIALKMAQASLLRVETGLAPLLLIDDIFGELDPQRRTSLLKALPPDSQCFITTTNLSWTGDYTIALPIFHLSHFALKEVGNNQEL